MKYYIGKWKLENGVYMPPDGMSAGLDLRSIPDQQNPNQHGNGLFWGNATLDSDYAFLGNGDVREIKSSGRLTNIFESILKYTPKGDTLNDLIFDILTDGSHPDGQSGVRSLVPGSTYLLYSLFNHGPVKAEKFNINHKHFNKVRDVLREAYREAELTSDGLEHRKFLTVLGIRYGIADPENHFIPKGMAKEKPLPPSTTFTETWPTDGNNITTGQDLTWNINDDYWDVVSGELQNVENEDADTFNIRAEHDLSDDDMSTTVDIISLDAPSAGSSFVFNGVAVAVRRKSTNTEGYYFEKQKVRNGDQQYVVYKYVGIQQTTLVSTTTLTGSLLGNSQLSVVGSTLTYGDGTTTEGSTSDTSIVGNLRGGVWFIGDYEETSSGGVSIDTVTITDDTEDPPPVEPVRDIPLQVLSGTFVQSPFVGSQSISLPFSPKVMLLMSSDNVADSGTDANMALPANPNGCFSLGYVTDSGGSVGEYGVYPQCAGGRYLSHGGTNLNVAGACRAHTPSGCFIMVGETDDSTQGSFQFETFGSANLTQMGTTTKLNWDQTDGRHRIISYLAIGGTEIKNYGITQINTPQVSGIVDYPLGFAPDVLFSLTAGVKESGRIAPDTNAALGYGFSVGSGIKEQQSFNYWMSNDIFSKPHPPNLNFPRSYMSRDNRRLIVSNFENPGQGGFQGGEDITEDPYGALYEVSAATSGLHGNGFMLDWWDVKGSGSQSFVLGIEGGLYHVSSFRGPSVVGATPYQTEQDITGLPHRPIAMISYHDTQKLPELEINGREQGGYTWPAAGAFSAAFSSEDLDLDVRDSPTSKTSMDHPLTTTRSINHHRVGDENTIIVESRTANQGNAFREIVTLDSFNNDGFSLSWGMLSFITSTISYLTIGSKFAYADPNLYTKGAENSGAAGNYEMLLDALTFPGDFPFSTTGGNMNVGMDMIAVTNTPSVSGFPCHIIARDSGNVDFPMYLLVPSGSGVNDVFPFHAVGPEFYSEPKFNMSIAVNDLISDSGNFDLFVWSTTNPGLFKTFDFSINNQNIGPFASMNMYQPNTEIDDLTSNMNMFVKNGVNEDGSSPGNNNLTMYIGASGAINTLDMFVNGPEGFTGATPFNDNMNMVIYSNTSAGDATMFMPGPSGEDNNLTFHMSTQTSNSGVPFHMESIDSLSRPNNLFVRGF